MKNMMIGRFMTWFAAGMFATGLSYEMNGEGIYAIIQYFWAAAFMAGGIGLIKKGGKENE